MGFLINSEIHPYILKRPLLLACQVEIKASDYSFLDHDSYIACNELFFFKNTELIDKRCSVNIATKANIQKVVAAAHNN